MNKNHIIFVVVLASILLLAGGLHLAYRATAQLYLNLHQADEKQNAHIITLYQQLTELERKLAVFEEHLKTEARARAQ